MPVPQAPLDDEFVAIILPDFAIAGRGAVPEAQNILEGSSASFDKVETISKPSGSHVPFLSWHASRDDILRTTDPVSSNPLAAEFYETEVQNQQYADHAERARQAKKSVFPLSH